MSDRHPIVQRWLEGDNDAGGCIAELERELVAAEALLPSTFYADRPFLKRQEFIVDGWRRAIEVNQNLESQITTLTASVKALREALEEMYTLYGNPRAPKPTGVIIGRTK